MDGSDYTFPKRVMFFEKTPPPFEACKLPIPRPSQLVEEHTFFQMIHAILLDSDDPPQKKLRLNFSK